MTFSDLVYFVKYVQKARLELSENGSGGLNEALNYLDEAFKMVPNELFEAAVKGIEDGKQR